MLRWSNLIAGACLCLSLQTAAAGAADTTIFAAASLKTALDEVARTFEAKTGQTFAISYAGTSVLARQIAMGAPADIVITASTDWMDWLEAQNAIEPDSRFDLLSNQLVLIEHGSAASANEKNGPSLRHRIGQSRIALALVEAVPAGIYGKSALESLGVWEALKPQVVQTDNVRATLALVASGEVAFGIVYATDALADPRVSVITTFAPNTHANILYPVATVAGRSSEQTARFIDYLRSQSATGIFKTHGFSMAVSSR